MLLRPALGSASEDESRVYASSKIQDYCTIITCGNSEVIEVAGKINSRVFIGIHRDRGKRLILEDTLDNIKILSNSIFQNTAADRSACHSQVSVGIANIQQIRNEKAIWKCALHIRQKPCCPHLTINQCSPALKVTDVPCSVTPEGIPGPTVDMVIFGNDGQTMHDYRFILISDCRS